jgi:hypothetical protein
MGNWKPELIERAFADAALDPTLWVKALDIVASITGSKGAGLFPASDGLPNVPYSEPISATMEDYLENGWNLRDERQNGHWSVLRSVAVVMTQIGYFERRKDARSATNSDCRLTPVFWKMDFS